MPRASKDFPFSSPPEFAGTRMKRSAGQTPLSHRCVFMWAHVEYRCKCAMYVKDTNRTSVNFNDLTLTGCDFPHFGDRIALLRHIEVSASHKSLAPFHPSPALASLAGMLWRRNPACRRPNAGSHSKTLACAPRRTYPKSL